MKTEAYIHKKFLFFLTLASIIMLTVGITAKILTLIIIGTLLTLISFLFLKVYLVKPAFIVENNAFLFYSIYGKFVQYDFEQITSITYDEKYKRIIYSYKGNKDEQYINNTYNIPTKELYSKIIENMNRG